jgi:hypothetical protein
MPRLLTTLILLAGGLGLPIGAAAAEPPRDAAGIEFFEKKIRPVLVRHCAECHAADSKTLRGGLLVDSRGGLLAGGDSGPAVVPGKPDESLLLEALRYESFEMPPTGKLPDAVIADFAQWIEMGLPDPRTATGQSARTTREGIDVEAGRDFWAFRPLADAPLPSVKNADWPRSPVDRFVLAALEDAGVGPSPPADAETLLRRLYFTLIGLPPSPEEIDRFLAELAAAESSPRRREDAEEEAVIARWVDDLLASPRYGERWGRHWLDVVRFAESTGGGRTAIFPAAYRYRDYVIESFNNDKPFDRFAREQIAGDLMPADSLEQRNEQIIATGFLVLGPTNYELQDKELLRMEVVDEQIDTIGKAFLGMTVGCARCHDHKFDPIPTADYYALAGIFRSTKTLTPGNVAGYETRPLYRDDAHRDALVEYEARLAALQTELDAANTALKKIDKAAAKAGRNDVVALESLPGVVVDDANAELTGTWARSTSVKPFVDAGYQHATGGDLAARFTLPIEDGGRYEIRVAYSASTNRAPAALVTVRHADGAAEVRIDQRATPAADGLFHPVGTFRFEAGQPATVELSTRGTAGVVIIDAVQALPAEMTAKPQAGGEPKKPDPEAERRQQAIAAARAELKKLETAMAALKKSAPPPAPMAMSVKEQAEPGDYFICIRGNAHNLGEQVPRGFLSVLGGGPATIPAGASGRVELAGWLTSPENALFARVIVNRVWRHVFGEGLVPTPDNFGSSGRPPTHPELLDHLAAEFIADGYRVKPLVRRLVLSAAFRQRSGELRAESGEPEEGGEHGAKVGETESGFGSQPSALSSPLFHFPRHRLDAEALRDAMLAVSGELDLTLGGPTVPPGLRSEYGYEFTGTRRSVYVPVFRNSLHPLMEAFDFADPNIVQGDRNTSVLPTQALFLMNSPFVMVRAQAAAGRLLARADLDDEARITRVFRETLARHPTEAERSLTRNYLNSFAADQQKAAWERVYHSLFASLDFRYLR